MNTRLQESQLVSQWHKWMRAGLPKCSHTCDYYDKTSHCENFNMRPPDDPVRGKHSCSGRERRQKIPTEHEEQRELVRWFRQTFNGVRILAVPNGGARSKATAGRLKAEGVSAGVPDLFVPSWRLWIEMKRQKGGSVSSDQKDWMAYLESAGYCCIVCKGADDAKAKIIEFCKR